MTEADDAGVFRALADATRRQILEDLRPGELTAGEIASRFPISGPSISRHLGVLKSAGLIRERREANKIFYSLVEDRLALCLGRFVAAVCPDQFVLRHRLKKARTTQPPTTQSGTPEARTTQPPTTQSGTPEARVTRTPRTARARTTQAGGAERESTKRAGREEGSA